MLYTLTMLSFLLFQVPVEPEIDSGVIGTMIERIIAVGFTGTMAIAMFILWWKERARASKERDKWNAQIVKDKEATDLKVEVLYREIRDGQKAENDKYITIIQKQNEIQEHTVKALQDNTEVVRGNTEVMGHNMKIMDKHVAAYEKFISMLFKEKING